VIGTRRTNYSMVAVVLSALLSPARASAEMSLRKIGELDIPLFSFGASVEPVAPVVPKGVASAVRVAVNAGSRSLSTEDAVKLFGPGLTVHGVLAGPGLAAPVTLPLPNAPDLGDPLLLPLPALQRGGDYTLTNVRIARAGVPLVDARPRTTIVKVVDQVLVTAVKTRPLSFEELQERGIILDSRSYTGFEFNLALQLESKAVEFKFPVVFDHNNVPVPMPLQPPPAPVEGLVSMPLVVPMLLELDDAGLEEGEKNDMREALRGGPGITIPSVLVIPGNVGFLMQHFSATLYVANGAPGGSGLTIRDVKATIDLPDGQDPDDPADDPLVLATRKDGTAPTEWPVRHPGPDGEPDTDDDVGTLAPGVQGQAEFVIRGEKEGFFTIDFDINAKLDGLPVGPVPLRGAATGGVLVRNACLSLSFVVPGTVRVDEPFSVFVTVSNITEVDAEGVNVQLDAGLSGMRLNVEKGETGARLIPTLKGNDSETLEFLMVAKTTGQVVASYLDFNGPPGNCHKGTLNFSLGVGDRGVPLSPDTLVLPSAVDSLPPDVVRAAMRVLGQAWSIANAPAGALPPRVTRTNKNVVTKKALALAEAGLRVILGQTQRGAVRDLVFDFWGGEPVDPGFDQVLRQTEAGRKLAEAISAFLDLPAGESVVAFEEDLARLAASGANFVSFAVEGRTDVAVVDGQQRLLSAGADAKRDIPGAVLLQLGPSTVGVLTAPGAFPYVLKPGAPGSVTFIGADGNPRRAAWSCAVPEIRIDPAATDPVVASDGCSVDGSDLARVGPTLVSATMVGPKILSAAGPHGFHIAYLFDRIVDAAAAADTSHYQHQDNRLRTAKRQLSGRLVFGTLDQPEGPYIPRTLTVGGITDRHGTVGAPVTQALSSLLEYPGGVLSGRVMHADGSPVTAGNVVYENGVTVGCTPAGSLGFALLPLTDGGRFEFRYVLQTCAGWRISAQDPVDGSVRDARGRVAATGEQIVRDLVLLGRGAVEGIVRAGATLEPVGGANVVALSLTDQQIGGSAKTNGDGYYKIDGITVGAVTVKAGDGQVVGTNTGRIERAGTVAKIDVTLNATGVRVSGYVKTEEGGVLKPVGQGIYVSYALQGTLVPRTFGVTQTDAAGRFLLEDMPEGEYILTAAINTRDRGEVTGFAGSVTSVEQDIVIHIPPPGELANVSGRILLPSSDPNVEILASGMEVVVDMDGRGVMTTNGTFHLTGLLIDPTRARSIRARTRDGKRTGNVSVYVDRPSVTDVKIRLSGLGKAVFTVLDPRGEKMQGVTVRVGGRCKDPCGCSPQVTDSAGEVTFHDVPIGGLAAKATWTSPGGGVDIAAGTATVLADGTTGFGILRFAGFGIVHGTVRYPEGQGEPEKGGPLHGATVSLTSLYYDSGLCVLTNGYSQSARTDTSGTFRFENVNVGRVSVAAQHFVLGRAGANGTLVKDGQELPLDLRMTDTMAERLTGVVYMPDGKTPAGAGVDVKATGGSIGELEVVTQPDGSYKFARVLGAGGYTITASDPRTGLVARQSIYLPKDPDPLVDEPVIHDLRLKGRGSVRVSVVNAAGTRIENAFVKLTETEFPNRTFESTLDPSDDGVVTIENVDEGRFAVVVSDSLARGGRASGVMPGEGAVVNVQVTFTVTNTVKGHFLLPAKGPTATPTPVPFGTVKLTSGGRVVGQMTTEGSGPNIGAFEFTFVPAGDFKLEAQDPMTGRTGFASGAVEKEGPPPPEHLAPAVVVDVYAMDLGIVRGKITHNGVDYTGPVHIDLVSGTYKVATVATGGTYEIPGVPEGKVVVTASLGDQGFLSGTASSTLKDEGEILPLDVALRGSGTVEGRVERVKLDGSRVAGPPSQVTIQVGGSGGGTLSTFTDDGQFRFEQVPAGLATLTADVLTGEDRGKATVEVPAQADPPVNVPITLNGTTSLKLFAVDEDDNSIEGSVSIVGTGDFPFTRYREIRPEGITLTDLLAGPVNVRLTYRPENQPIRYGSISDTLVADVPKTITVKLQPGAFVAGRVFRSNGDPAGGAKVEIYAHLGGLITWVQAQDDGSFVANGIPLAQAGATRQITVKLIDELTDGRGLVENQTLGEPGITLEPPVTLDDTPISLVSIEPPNGTVGVSVTQPLRLTFTDPVAGTGGILVKDGAAGTFVHASLSADKKVVTLTPGFGAWPDGRPLTIVATTFVTDIFGRRLAAEAQSVFHTVDVSPPTVVSVSPANLQREVLPGATMIVTFSEPLRATGVEPLSAGVDPVVRLKVYPSGPDVPGAAVLSAPAVVTFTPSLPLDSDTRYSLVVNGAVDLSGNPQTQASSTTFWTRDTIAPVLALTQPAADGWTNMPRPTISVGITEAGTGADTTADGSKLWLDCQAPSLDGCEPVNASRTASSLSFVPPSDLSDGLHMVAARVKDKAQPPNLGTLAAAFGVDTVLPGPAGLTITGGATEGSALVLRGSVGLAAAALDASSGVARIEVRRGTGTLVETLLPPSFAKTYNTALLSEGPHLLYAIATDVAGNVGDAGVKLPVVVDNIALGVTIDVPAAGERFRNTVEVRATASAPVVSMQFSVGGGQPADGVLVSNNTYMAVLSLASLADGNVTITVTALDHANDTKTVTRTIVVDQAPPSAPDATRIEAEENDGGDALVLGRAGAVEPLVRVEAVNITLNGAVRIATAAGDGSFALKLAGVEGHVLALTAVDAVGNRSTPTSVVVARKNTSDGVPLTGMALWVKADAGVVADGSGFVSQWQDQSPGAANHLVQTTGTAKPVLVPDAGNGMPTLQFDGTDVLSFTTRLTAIGTAFWVIQDTAPTNDYRFLLNDASSSDFHGGNPAIWLASVTSSSILSGQTWLNGVPIDGTTTPRPRSMSVLSVVTSSPTGNLRADRFGSGNQASRYWSGRLAELILYDRPLSGSDRKAVEDYLALKYALYVPTTATPTISPNGGGSFSGSTTIQLASTTPSADIYYTLDGTLPDPSSSTLYTGPFTIGQSTTIRAKAFRSGLTDSGTAIATFIRVEDTSPGSIEPGSLRLWLRADAGVTSDAAGRVSAWRDQSGANDATQGLAANQPRLIVHPSNGLPAMHFDGNDMVQFTTRLTTIGTVFWVIEEDLAATNDYRFPLHDASSSDFHGGNPQIWLSSATSSSILNGQTWLNGSLINGLTTTRPKVMSVLSVVTSSPTGNLRADRFGSGNLAGRYWWGNLAELVIYDKPLSPMQRKAVEDYLLNKYRLAAVTAPQITPNGGTFTGSAEVRLQTPTAGADIYYTTDGSEPTTSSLRYTAPFVLSASTTVKAKAFATGRGESAMVTAGFTNDADFNPRSVTGLQLWLRADAGVAAGHGGLWEDQSGNDNHVTQTNGLATPRLEENVSNGLPAMHFDGNDMVQFTTRLTTIGTVFWVIGEDLAATSGYRFPLHDISSSDFHGGNPQIWLSNATSSSILDGQTWLNGSSINGVATTRPKAMSVLSVVTSLPTGNLRADRFGSGNQASRYWWGHLAELVIYDRPLPEPVRLTVEQYLMTRHWRVSAVPASGQVALSWMPHPKAVGYDVLRSTSPGSGYLTRANAISATQFTDTGVTAGTYYYVVVAHTSTGSQYRSAELSVVVP